MKYDSYLIVKDIVHTVMVAIEINVTVAHYHRRGSITTHVITVTEFLTKEINIFIEN